MCATIFVLCWDLLLVVAQWMIDIPYHVLPSVQDLETKQAMKGRFCRLGCYFFFWRWHMKDVFKCRSIITMTLYITCYSQRWSWSWYIFNKAVKIPKYSLADHWSVPSSKNMTYKCLFDGKRGGGGHLWSLYRFVCASGYQHCVLCRLPLWKSRFLRVHLFAHFVNKLNIFCVLELKFWWCFKHWSYLIQGIFEYTTLFCIIIIIIMDKRTLWHNKVILGGLSLGLETFPITNDNK